MAKYLVKIARLLPRVGTKLFRNFCNLVSVFKNYPIDLPINPFDAIRSNNVFFPLLKYDCYPH
jgi:hypothetical protein